MSKEFYIIVSIVIVFIVLQWIWLREKGLQFMATAKDLQATVDNVLREVQETATLIQEQIQRIIELTSQLGLSTELQAEVDDATTKLNDAANTLNSLQNPTSPTPPAPIVEPPPQPPI